MLTPPRSPAIGHTPRSPRREPVHRGLGVGLARAEDDRGELGVVNGVGEMLGLERSNLYRKMRAFGIVPARKEEESV